jgi:hypothetical protein
MVVVTWIEDKPSLRQVTVTNPRTNKKVVVPIPQESLDRIAKISADLAYFNHLATIPVALLGGVTPDDTLLIRKRDSGGGGGAPCYACMELSTTQP